MDYKKTAHSHAVLFHHIESGMVHERAFLMERKLVDKTAARRHRLLGYTSRAIHMIRHFQPMPVYAGRFGKFIH